jgi:uncharacterized membrane protein YfcA
VGVSVTWLTGVQCVVSGLVIAAVTAPAGVSGAVFLLPVQVSLLGVPSPAVTPTNLLFNVVATPGALLRYRRRGRLASPLTGLLLVGTLPGVVIGALIRVFALPGARVFRVVIAAVLLSLGVWLCWTTLRRPVVHRPVELSRRVVGGLAFAVGIVGGIYGIGGGSILGPILVGRGLPVAVVAPAALASTFVTSIVGAGAYALIQLGPGSGAVGPMWSVGLLCGLGGLVGGYLGALVQPRVSERFLRLLLGSLAVAIALLYTVQAVD